MKTYVSREENTIVLIPESPTGESQLYALLDNATKNDGPVEVYVQDLEGRCRRAFLRPETPEDEYEHPLDND